jgi:hypothetical protein
MAVTTSRGPRYERPAFRCVVLGILGVFAFCQGLVAVFFRYNDVGGHIDQGGLALRDGLSAVSWVWYPLARITFVVGLALLSPNSARALCYALALLTTAVSFRMWYGLLPAERRPGRQPSRPP